MEGPVGVPANPDRYHWQFLAIGTNQVSLDPVETPILVSAVFRRVDPYRQLADTGHQFIGVFLSKSCLSEKLVGHYSDISTLPRKERISPSLSLLRPFNQLRRFDEFFLAVDHRLTSLCPRSAKPLSRSRASKPPLVPIVAVSSSRPCFSSCCVNRANFACNG